MIPVFKKSFLILCLLLYALSFSASKQKIDKELQSKRNELNALKKELQRQKAAIKKTKKKEGKILKLISQMESDINTSRKYLRNLEENESLLKESISGLRLSVDSLDQQIDFQKVQIADKVRSLYVKGQPEVLEFFLNGKDSRSFQKSWFYILRLVRSDDILIQNFRQTVNSKKKSEKELESNLTQLQANKEETVVSQFALERKKKDQAKVLKDVQNNRRSQEKALKEFEENQKFLTELIKKLEVKRKREIERVKRELAKAKKEKERQNALKQKRERERQLQYLNRKVADGKCWPIKGKVISKFGLQVNPKLKTKTRNLGIEIRGKLGQKVKNVTHGEVVLVTKLPGHGTGIVIDHGSSYYSVYGHLQDVFVNEGQVVDMCDVIASVGEEDSMNGPKLFFQINKGAKNIDPMKWLKKAKR